MTLWEVMLSIFWFMLLVAWFWLVITIITDIFRDSELSGWSKAAWCLFVLVLPWIGVLTYLLVRGRSMNERTAKAAADNEQAFRRYVQQAASSGPGVADELGRLAELYDGGVISAEDYELAKRRVLADSGAGTRVSTPPRSSDMSA
jgi:hypothetical protein